MTWHRAVEYLVSVSNRVIYILSLLLNYKYDNIVRRAATSNIFTCYIFCWWTIGGGRRPRAPCPYKPVQNVPVLSMR